MAACFEIDSYHVLRYLWLAYRLIISVWELVIMCKNEMLRFLITLYFYTSSYSSQNFASFTGNSLKLFTRKSCFINIQQCLCCFSFSSFNRLSGLVSLCSLHRAYWYHICCGAQVHQNTSSLQYSSSFVYFFSRCISFLCIHYMYVMYLKSMKRIW